MSGQIEKAVTSATPAFQRQPGPGLVPKRIEQHMGDGSIRHRTVYVRQQDENAHGEGHGRHEHAPKEHIDQLTKKNPKDMSDKELWQVLSSKRHERNPKARAILDAAATEYRNRRGKAKGRVTKAENPWLFDPQMDVILEEIALYKAQDSALEDVLQKAGLNRAHLVKKKIPIKGGGYRTYWVKPGGGHQAEEKPRTAESPKSTGPQSEKPKESMKPPISKVPKLKKTHDGQSLPPSRNWIDSVPGLPVSTLEEYFDLQTGKYKDPAREKLHQAIEDSFFEGKKPVPKSSAFKPSVIFMMGGPASGKTTMVKSGTNLDNFVVADADAVKEKIPEYIQATAQSARNAALMAHEESSLLVKRIRARALREGYNTVVDGTGAKVATYLETLKIAQAQGYHTRAFVADCDLDIAWNRAQNRAQKTGRWVPEDVVAEAYANDNIAKNFNMFSKVVDEYHVFDSRDGIPPKHVASKVEDQVTIHDQAKAETFAKRAGMVFKAVLSFFGLLKAEPPQKKKPTLALSSIVETMMAGFRADEKALKGMASNYDKNDGIIDVASEAPTAGYKKHLKGSR